MRKICILTKTKKPGVIGAMAQAQKFFVKRNYQVFTKLNRTILKNGLDWIIVLGGDGAMLHMANKVAGYGLPLIGVNFGRKGYLCEIAKNEINKGLGKLHSNSFSIIDYTRVRARVFKAKKIIKEIDALNEIVVGGINRMVWLELNIHQNKKKKSAVVIGDGIIFSTQIGSTAYNLWSGGPVLACDVFSVVVCNGLFESDYFLPNTKAFVVPTNTHFEVKTLRGGQHLPYVVADGQRDYRLAKGDKVIVEKSPMVTKLIKLK